MSEVAQVNNKLQIWYNTKKCDEGLGVCYRRGLKKTPQCLPCRVLTCFISLLGKVLELPQPCWGQVSSGADTAAGDVIDDVIWLQKGPAKPFLLEFSQI